MRLNKINDFEEIYQQLSTSTETFVSFDFFSSSNYIAHESLFFDNQAIDYPIEFILKNFDVFKDVINIKFNIDLVILCMKEYGNTPKIIKQISDPYKIENLIDITDVMGYYNYMKTLGDEHVSVVYKANMLIILENYYRSNHHLFSFDLKKQRRELNDELIKQIDVNLLKQSIFITKYDADKWHEISNKNDITESVSFNKFDIVIPTYNAYEKLKELIASINNQNYSLEYIDIYVIDDGSTDLTSEIKNDFPNVTYLYQDNNGVSNARNNGVNIGVNEYIIFVDDDDKLNVDFLSEFNNAINNFPNINLFTSNIFEVNNDRAIQSKNSKEKVNKKYRYTIIDLEVQPERFNANVSGCCFKRSLMKSLQFNEQLNFFEDSLFCTTYLINNNITKYIIAKDAHYLYTKGDDSSLSSNIKNKLIYNVFENGYLKLLQTTDKEYVKNLVLKSLYWIVRENLKWNSTSFSDYLEEEKQLYFKQFKKINDYFDSELLERNIYEPYDSILFKKKFNIKEAMVYDHYITKEHLVLYVSGEIDSIMINDDIVPVEVKSLTIDCFEQIIDLKNKMYFPKVEIVKNIVINNQTINYNIDVFPNQVKSTTLLVNDVVIYMDSIFNAGDNAEILYRQKGKKTHKNSYFVLSKKSNDWDRLKDEFKLLEYGSTEFKKLYKETKLIYSSHADKFILNYDNSRSNECNFIFLQHGVINNDMSNWLFDKKIDNIVSSLDFETKLLNKVFLNSEILEVGLARFNDRDTKIKRIFKKKKYITYFTSWSEQLLLMNNQEFLKSGFYKRIIDFTTSVDVKRYANKNKYEIKVVVHPQLRDKINDSNISEYLYTGSYREIIKDTGFAITDYSSVIYELDHLGIPCLFFNQKEYEHEYFCQKKIIKDIGYENRSIKHINNISEFTNDNIKQENNEKIKNN